MVNASRLGLDGAGNPAYGVIVDTSEGLEFSPMVYAALRPAMLHCERLAATAEPGESIYIVSRAQDGERVAFTIMDVKTRKLHEQFEVIEKSIAEEDSLL
jgi:hypothetical protein